ncbi:hypothetical protein EGI22_15875 [Lacihabitans sp. LS3-19]|nr:hypothetical protein [Lacihabitans sp. LS3-19]
MDILKVCFVGINTIYFSKLCKTTILELKIKFFKRKHLLVNSEIVIGLLVIGLFVFGLFVFGVPKLLGG